MKRVICIFCVFLLLTGALSLPAAAQETNREDVGTAEDYLARFEELLPDDGINVGDVDGLLEQVSVEGILAMLASALGDMGASLLSFVLLLLGACCLLCVLPAQASSVGGVVQAALGAVLSLMVYERLHVSVRGVIEGVRAASAFFASLTPLLGAITLAGGAKATGAAQAFSMGLIAEGLQLCTTRLLLPLTSLLFGLGLVGTLGDGGGAHTLCARIRHVFLWICGLVGTLLAATLGLQTVLTTSADTVAMRTVKYTVAGSLPIVGGTVSGALSTLATGLLYIKSTVGVGAVAVLLSLLLAPLVCLAAYRLAIGFCNAVWQYICPDRPAPLLDAFSGALDTTLAVGCLSCVLMIFACVCFIKSGVALAS